MLASDPKDTARALFARAPLWALCLCVRFPIRMASAPLLALREFFDRTGSLGGRGMPRPYKASVPSV